MLIFNMLNYHLKNALSDLKELVKITNLDIEDIKKSNNYPKFNRLALKDEKLKNLKYKKTMIDSKISSLINKNPTTDLTKLPNKHQNNTLNELQHELRNLKEVNHKYTKILLTTSVLYNDFLDELVS
ncbi:MAG: hypothetical protein U9N02_02985 [Campylobacterota bacterium]|nr:hypothetical protein [Campylobacterota bacterium]